VIDEPDVGLPVVIALIGDRARARAAGRFRAAAALGIAVPAFMLVFGYFFISSVVQTRCLGIYGGLGACDPLQQIAAVAMIGQLLVLGVSVGALLRSRRRPVHERSVAGICLAIASSAGWALVTSLFAAQWMSGNHWGFLS
jgi:hypothetical protein